MTTQIKITQPGYDVLTETDKDNFIFHSDYNTFKIVATGTSDITVGATTVKTTDIAHGLSYIPTFMGFMEYTAGSVVLPLAGKKYTGATTYYYFKDMYSDATNLSIVIDNNTAGSLTFKVRYYLFETPL